MSIATETTKPEVVGSPDPGEKKERLFGNEYYKSPDVSIGEALKLYELSHPEHPLVFTGQQVVADSKFVKMSLEILGSKVVGKRNYLDRGFNKYLPPDLGDNLSAAYNDGVGKNFRYDIKTMLEDLREVNGEPLGIREMLYTFLVESEGDISKAIHNAHIFFKDLSRGLKVEPFIDSEKPEWMSSPFSTNGAQALADAWFKENIKDELALVSPYQRLPVKLEVKPINGKINHNKELRGQIGRIYHFFGILDMLDKLSPLEVSICTMGEYIENYKDHGSEKFLADMNILLSLQNIYNRFNSYREETST